jgi:hypothetical protein
MQSAPQEPFAGTRNARRGPSSRADRRVPVIVRRVDRRAMARAQRRRQAVDALEFERARAELLQEQLESIAAELDGPALDEAAFAAMAPEDVEIVRPLLFGEEAEPLEEPEAWALEWHEATADPEPDPAEQEAEVARLQEELDESRRRQQALERYLAALGE